MWWCRIEYVMVEVCDDKVCGDDDDGVCNVCNVIVKLGTYDYVRWSMQCGIVANDNRNLSAIVYNQTDKQ